jgi:leucyl/phenylalanyl-tRNA--protein transferase
MRLVFWSSWRMSSPQPALTTRERDMVAAALDAYARGWFPMYDPDSREVDWVQPHQRALIPLDDRFRITRSLRAAVNSARFTITGDTAFDQVIHACAQPAKGRETTWLDDSITSLFRLLHRAGHAHSVEAWLPTPDGPSLAGGLYGLALGSIFCGESMFSAPAPTGTNASKVCLVHLVHHLRRQGFTLLDAQLKNPHLEQFGLYEMDQPEYATLLSAAASQAREWSPWPTAHTDQSIKPAVRLNS